MDKDSLSGVHGKEVSKTCSYVVMPRMKLTTNIMDSDLEDSDSSLDMDTSMNDMDDVLEDGDVLRLTFLTSWGEFSTTLEDIVVLLQLLVFSHVDLTFLRPDSYLLKLARYLQRSLSDTYRYAKELSKSSHVEKSFSKDKHPMTCRSSKGKEVVCEKQDSKRKKITVKKATFIAYWLSRYVFLGPADEYEPWRLSLSFLDRSRRTSFTSFSLSR
ncbi:hypothetical protein AHAS_Ahas16G0129000 [Arachis hypogaea]